MLWIGVGLVAAGLTACGTDPASSDDIKQGLVDAGVDAELAECAADAVVDNLSADQIVALMERGPAGAPRDDPERTEDDSDKVRAAIAECKEQVATTVPVEPTPPGLPAASTTTATETD